MREKWKALTKRERLLFAAALVFLALAVLLRFVPGLRFSALLCLCATAVLFIFYLLEHFARRGHRAAAWCELALIAALLLGFSLFTVLETMVVRGSFADESDAPVSAVIVLGAGVNGTVPSQALRERLEAAQDYLARYPEAIAVLSGAQGDGEAITEAQCMYDWLTARGVVPDRLRMETKATTTEENLRCSLDLIEAETGTRPAQIAVVSGEYHLLRAELLARRAGAEALGVPSYTHDRAFYCLMLAREVCGVWAALLF